MTTLGTNAFPRTTNFLCARLVVDVSINDVDEPGKVTFVSISIELNHV